MSNLGPQRINQSFGDLLQLPNGLTGSLQAVQDGSGNVTPLQISNTDVQTTFIQAGTGAVMRTMQNKVREQVSVLDFGADPTGAINSQPAIQLALNYANSIGGADVIVPDGNYALSASVSIYANTTLRGMGWGASVLTFTHTGAGVKSTWPINSSTSANVNVIGISLINSNGSNTDGGFVDVGGTYVNIENCLIQGWKYGIIFDQTEVANIHRNNITGNTTAQIWLVNGPEYTVGSLPNFTNKITITNNQLNALATADLILDDGGITHSIENNNFNGGRDQIRICGTNGLVISGNEFEAADGTPINVRKITSGSVTRGGIYGFSITGNTIGTTDTAGHNYNLYINEAHCGDITGNYFYYAKVAAVECNSDYNISNISVHGNIVANKGGAKTSTPIVQVGAYDNWVAQGLWRQGITTYSTTSGTLGPGYVGIDFPVAQRVLTGDKLYLVNADGTNGETVTIASYTTGNLTFFATLTSSKSQGFLIFGLPGSGVFYPLASVGVAFPPTPIPSSDPNTLDDYEEGSWTGAFQSDTGTISTDGTIRTGSYIKIGRQVTATGYFKISSVSTPGGDLYLFGLPYPVTAGNANVNAGSVLAFGFAATATTQIVASASSSYILFRKYAAGTHSAMASDALANATVSLTVTYFTD